MWLLSTNRVQLQHFHSPAEVPGGYAILSHVWQDHEETFQQIQSLQHSGQEVAHAYDIRPKIHGSVNVARWLGYAWVWIDTVCIDKTNSTELEEAINSMFRWYAESSVCLAYLADVPDDCHVEAPQSTFRKSKWFTRGWTLQELIAPRQLLFMSEGWKCLGTKASLADLVEEITGIDAEVLTFRRVLDHVSVARRMSWASGRVTSKVEDEAYSLMGLFDVSMSTIYGEGKNAFRRLQEEIMKRSPDHTLFAWGNIMSDAAETWTSQTHRHKKDIISSLFAPSPTAFKRTGAAHPVRLTSVHLDAMVKLVRSCIEVSNAKPRVSPFNPL
ncbi:HET-domain-containing protein [Trametes coccinea BRFM310]|uniref:HET-domain-containing protein n=1 Tax=Trametes coccinea (strain BRFM310) TaxID=1353009 RepID=A0A1Y2IJ15_TRAC3|nr:HET-domain-containing protein [Trametes coccinea BRFM310]